MNKQGNLPVDPRTNYTDFLLPAPILTIRVSAHVPYHGQEPKIHTTWKSAPVCQRGRYRDILTVKKPAYLDQHDQNPKKYMIGEPSRYVFLINIETVLQYGSLCTFLHVIKIQRSTAPQQCIFLRARSFLSVPVEIPPETGCSRFFRARGS